MLLSILFWLGRDEADRPVQGGILRHPRFGALLTWHAQVFHMAVVAFVIGADDIGGSAFLMWIPAACVTAVYWSTLSEARPTPPSGQADGQADQAAHEVRAESLGLAR